MIKIKIDGSLTLKNFIIGIKNILKMAKNAVIVELIKKMLSIVKYMKDQQDMRNVESQLK